jgi:hypothetical protein
MEKRTTIDIGFLFFIFDLNSATLWRIFSSNKIAPANTKKGFYANHNPNKQEVGFIFV